MLYFSDPAKRKIDPVESPDAAPSTVKDVEIETALASRPESFLKAATVHSWRGR
jgi:hypothetical protein